MLQAAQISADPFSPQLGLEERGPTAIDLIVEASGAEVFIQTSILLLCSGTCARTVTRGGGSALPPLTHTLDMQLGMGQAEVQIPINTLLVKEQNFKGSFRYGVSTQHTHPALFSSSEQTHC